MSNFCSYSHFFSKNNCELDTVLARTINILTTNEFVKLTMLWTTGPWSFCHDCFSKQEWHKRLLSGGGINWIGSDNVKSVRLTPFLEHHQQLRQPFGKFLVYIDGLNVVFCGGGGLWVSQPFQLYFSCTYWKWCVCILLSLAFMNHLYTLCATVCH